MFFLEAIESKVSCANGSPVLLPLARSAAGMDVFAFEFRRCFYRD
jgi:hypothetical protein